MTKQQKAKLASIAEVRKDWTEWNSTCHEDDRMDFSEFYLQVKGEEL